MLSLDPLELSFQTYLCRYVEFALVELTLVSYLGEHFHSTNMLMGGGGQIKPSHWVTPMDCWVGL